MHHNYLLWFAHEHLDFRLPEVNSIIQMLGISIKWLSNPYDSPFWVAEFSVESDARLLASRSITLRSVILLWAHANTLQQLHVKLKDYPREKIVKYLHKDKSFCVQVDTFNKTFNMGEKVKKIEMFDYLPAEGSVNLKSPDTILHYIEFYGTDPNNVPDEPFQLFIGPWICNGRRELIKKLSLKTRKFIGNTTMDPQLSLIMANQAQVQLGDLVLDPFVGTGSLLVAAACFGGYVLGSDIDFLMLHGRSRPTRKQTAGKQRSMDESVKSNLVQYGWGSQYIDVIIADSSLPLWKEQLEFDAIITDRSLTVVYKTEKRFLKLSFIFILEGCCAPYWDLLNYDKWRRAT